MSASDPNYSCQSGASSAALALLPPPTSLESFLNAARAVRAAAAGCGPGPAANAPNCVAFCPGDLAEYVSRAAEVLLRTAPSSLANALDTLDVVQHSLGYAAVLTALVRHASSGNQPDWDWIHSRVIVLIDEADPRLIRLAPGALAELCHHFTDELIRRGCPLVGMAPVKRALNKINNNTEEGGINANNAPQIRRRRRKFATLTSVHSDLCKLALASRCFTPVLPMLADQDLIDISREAVLADSKYILLYFYYGGMIMTAVKNYRLALYYFELCVTIPSVAVSHIMVEAYKKYLLICLIEGGHRPKESQATLPKYTPAVVSKYFKQLTMPYNEVVTTYFCKKPGDLRQVVERNAQVFAADGNTGLVKRVVASRTQTDIKRLTKTFLTLSTSELAARVGLEFAPEAEQMVVGMISDGSINARISQKDGMVRFDALPSEQYKSESFLRSLESSVQDCVELNGQVEQLDEDISLNPAFIKRSHAAAASSSAAVAASSLSAADVDDSMANIPSFPVAAQSSSSSATSAHAPTRMMNGGASSTTGNGVPSMF